MAKDPAFLFYSQDFLTGTMLFTDEQVGKYIRILCLQHQKGRISEKDMLKICKSYDEDIFAKFIKDDDGYFFNERLQKESTKRSNYSNSRKNNRLTKNTLFENDDIGNHMSKHSANISKSHVQHMENENENTINNTVKLNNNSNNKKGGKDMSNISKSHDEHMKSTVENSEVDHYIGNWDLKTDIDDCLKYYLEQEEFKKDRKDAEHIFVQRGANIKDEAIFIDNLKKWGIIFNNANRGKNQKGL